MSVSKRLDRVFKKAKELPLDDSSKIFLTSDSHRGNNSWSDNFANNYNIFMAALNYYYKNGFTYIELGDADELWENRKFSDICRTYSHLFELLKKFYDEDRLHLIYGNHDMVKKDVSFVKKNLHYFTDEYNIKKEPLFPDIKCPEGLILDYKGKGKILLAHGHQGDLFNDRFWPVNRFFVRYFWRPLELIGFKDPTSPAKNYFKKREIERKLSDWAKDKNTMLISGHTHHPVFPKTEGSLYFNCGSAVYRGFITGIEIDKGLISLVKWSVRPNENYSLSVAREVMAGATPLEDFFD